MSESFVSIKKPDPVKEIKRSGSNSGHRAPPPPPRQASLTSVQQQPQPHNPSQAYRRTSEPATGKHTANYLRDQGNHHHHQAAMNVAESFSGDAVYKQNEEITVKCLTAERNYDNLKKVATKGK